MTRSLRPVGLEFADTAPVRLSFTARMTAPPGAVYRALAEEVEAWPRWFRAVSQARQAETRGRAGREVRLAGGVRFVETVMAADAPERYAYRADAANVPGLRALLEDWRITPAGGGAVVRWTFAADGAAPLRLALGFARLGLAHAFRDAVRALD
ncbi:SRPBCC family protein, partial [Streptomyces sp. NPDC049577]|uniref:SRPBCC family protein n=1 Tax=Streptomyces sp. NPDC049577 TaxID=3155153 RepID=UPI00341981B6